MPHSFRLFAAKYWTVNTRGTSSRLPPVEENRIRPARSGLNYYLIRETVSLPFPRLLFILSDPAIFKGLLNNLPSEVLRQLIITRELHVV